jgi:hypothetical protein
VTLPYSKDITIEHEPGLLGHPFHLAAGALVSVAIDARWSKGCHWPYTVMLRDAGMLGGKLKDYRYPGGHHSHRALEGPEHGDVPPGDHPPALPGLPAVHGPSHDHLAVACEQEQEPHGGEAEQPCSRLSEEAHRCVVERDHGHGGEQRDHAAKREQGDHDARAVEAPGDEREHPRHSAIPE